MRTVTIVTSFGGGASFALYTVCWPRCALVLPYSKQSWKRKGFYVLVSLVVALNHLCTSTCSLSFTELWEARGKRSYLVKASSSACQVSPSCEAYYLLYLKNNVYRAPIVKCPTFTAFCSQLNWFLFGFFTVLYMVRFFFRRITKMWGRMPGSYDWNSRWGSVSAILNRMDLIRISALPINALKVNNTKYQRSCVFHFDTMSEILAAPCSCQYSSKEWWCKQKQVHLVWNINIGAEGMVSVAAVVASAFPN